MNSAECKYKMNTDFLPAETHKGRNLSRKRNLQQIKEQDKATSRNLSEADISNMPDREFKAMIMRILTRLKSRGHK